MCYKLSCQTDRKVINFCSLAGAGHSTGCRELKELRVSQHLEHLGFELICREPEQVQDCPQRQFFTFGIVTEPVFVAQFGVSRYCWSSLGPLVSSIRIPVSYFLPPPISSSQRFKLCPQDLRTHIQRFELSFSSF